MKDRNIELTHDSYANLIAGFGKVGQTLDPDDWFSHTRCLWIVKTKARHRLDLDILCTYSGHGQNLDKVCSCTNYEQILDLQ